MTIKSIGAKPIVKKVNTGIKKINTSIGDTIKPISKVATIKAPAVPQKKEEELKVNMTPVESIPTVTEEPKEDKVIMTEEELGFQVEQENLETVIPEVNEEVKEEIPAETQEVDEVIAEVDEFINEDTIEAEEIVEVVEEEKPVEKKKETKKSKTTEKSPTEKDILDNVPLNELEDYLRGVVVPLNDEWTNEKREAEKQMRGIIIDSDMTPAEYTVLLAKIDNFKTDLLYRYLSAKSAYEQWCDKDGYMEQVKLLNTSGKNAEERKRNSVLSCRNFIPEGKDRPVNLYDAVYFVKDRYVFYKGLLEHLESKSKLIITISAMLKIQTDF